MTVEDIKQFFESSTIHGLYYISTTRRWSRLFWMLIVLVGFSGAGCLIYVSFRNWVQSPVTTTVETLPISQIKFPNVTICPPKTLFLNINYDILQSEQIKLDNEKREKMIKDSITIFQDTFYNEMTMNLRKLEDTNRYYNWYHGYTEIQYHGNYEDFRDNYIEYSMSTSTISGNISTLYFGEKLDVQKADIDINMNIYIRIYVPNSVMDDKDVKMTFDIHKNTMKKISGYDYMNMNDDDGDIHIDGDLTHWSKTITNPISKDGYIVGYHRQVSQDDIKSMNLEMMPGFRLTWYYNKQVEPEAKYSNDDTTKEFVR